MTTLERRLEDKLSKGEYMLDKLVQSFSFHSIISSVKDTHAKNRAKEEEQKRVDTAFGIQDE